MLQVLSIVCCVAGVLSVVCCVAGVLSVVYCVAGAGESGKSTIVKQMVILHVHGYSDRYVGGEG